MALRRRRYLIGATVAAAVVAAGIYTPSDSGTVPRPDPKLTPGDNDLRVTQANVQTTICVAGYTATVRNVPQSLKDQVYAEYRIISHAPGSYEVDHLVSLELGGSNAIQNLWPEPYTGVDNAHVKDQVENAAHTAVCDGSLTLAEAQHEIAADWVNLGKHLGVSGVQ